VSGGVVSGEWSGDRQGPLPLTTHHSPLTTLTGIDVLVRENFKRLQGARVGLVTNHSGLDRKNRSTIELFRTAPGLSLIALFSPEHGIRGALDERVADARDPQTGLPIYSLYGARRKPTAEILKGIDTLVYDIQDAGCRFYTYITTLGYILEAAADPTGARGEGSGARGKLNSFPPLVPRPSPLAPLKVVVLDRPNPIGGLEVEGPVMDAGKESFVGYYRLPVRHGMTVGELAVLYNSENKIGAQLEVVHMEGWRRKFLLADTGLHWVNPSPNLRSLTEALLYPGIGLLETTNLSVGRGTDRPFEWVGAPWIDGHRLAEALSAQKIPGACFAPLRLTPVSSVYKGQACDGVQVFITDWNQFEPLRTGLAFACTLRRLYPEQWQVDKFDALLKNRETLEGLKAGKSWQELMQGWQPELGKFRGTRAKYLLYPD